MKIAVDFQAFVSSQSKNRGIGIYCQNLFRQLLTVDEDFDFVFFDIYSHEKQNLSDYFPGQEKGNLFYQYTGNGDLFLFRYPDVIERLVRKFIREQEIDVFFFPSVFEQGNIFEKEWFDDVRTVAIVYDVIPYIFKEKYLRSRESYDAYLKKIDFLKSLDTLLVISRSVKEDLIEHFGIAEEKIVVIYAGVEEAYRKIDVSEREKRALFKKYGVNHDFIMCTGGEDTRKNMRELIVAYSELPTATKDAFDLVIVCKLSGEFEQELRRVIQRKNVEGRVILTNYIPKDDLILFYNLATIFAFPSQYEGFGLPVVEAMACGTPVLTSNNSSLKEIGEGLISHVNPFEIGEIRDGLLALLKREDLDAIGIKCEQEAKRYAWANVANVVEEELDTLAIERVEKQAVATKKIAMFTPLNPMQSGISDYSEDLIFEMAKDVAIDVFIDDGYVARAAFPENVQVFAHGLFEEKKDEYATIVFHVGNSVFHTYMFRYIKRHGGVVVLHDYNLHGLVRYLFVKDKKVFDYLRLLSIDYPEIRKGYLKKVLKQDFLFDLQGYEVNGFVVNYADKIIVHSDFAKRKLLEKNFNLNVKKIFSYAKKVDGMEEGVLREEKGIGEDEIVISAFGHISANKRIKQIVSVFRELLETRENLRLFLVGKLDEEMERYFRELFDHFPALVDVIRITGYIPLDEFVEYVAVSDICLNLRYPHNGETSASLGRLLRAGKPVIVSNVGSFEELPDDCCVKIGVDEEEMVDLKGAIEELIAKPNYRAFLGKSAAAYAEAHLRIEDVVQDYLDFIFEENEGFDIAWVIQDILRRDPNLGDYEDVYELSRTLAYSKM